MTATTEDKSRVKSKIKCTETFAAVVDNQRDIFTHGQQVFEVFKSDDQDFKFRFKSNTLKTIQLIYVFKLKLLDFPVMDKYGKVSAKNRFSYSVVQ